MGGSNQSSKSDFLDKATVVDAWLRFEQEHIKSMRTAETQISTGLFFVNSAAIAYLVDGFLLGDRAAKVENDHPVLLILAIALFAISILTILFRRKARSDFHKRCLAGARQYFGSISNKEDWSDSAFHFFQDPQQAFPECLRKRAEDEKIKARCFFHVSLWAMALGFFSFVMYAQPFMDNG